MAEETPVYFVDVVRELLEKQHGKPHEEGMGEVVADATLSQASFAALRALGKEAFAPVADVIASSGIGLLAQAAVITAHRKIKSSIARQRMAAKIDKKAEGVTSRRAARRMLMRKIVLENLGEPNTWGLPENQFKRREQRRREHKAKIARVSRAVIARLGVNALRGKWRDVTAGAVTAYIMTSVPLAGMAVQGLTALGTAAGLSAAIANPVGAFVVIAGVFVGSAVVLDRGLRAVTGGDAPLGPLFDYAVTRLLDKDKNPAHLARMQQRYAAIGKNICSIPKSIVQHLFAKKPVAQTAQVPARRTRPARRSSAYAAGLPQTQRTAPKSQKPRRVLAFGGTSAP